MRRCRLVHRDLHARTVSLLCPRLSEKARVIVPCGTNRTPRRKSDCAQSSSDLRFRRRRTSRAIRCRSSKVQSVPFSPGFAQDVQLTKPVSPFHSRLSIIFSTPMPAHIKSLSPLKRRIGIFASSCGSKYTAGTDFGVQKCDPTTPEHWTHSLPRVPSSACKALMTSGL